MVIHKKAAAFAASLVLLLSLTVVLLAACQQSKDDEASNGPEPTEQVAERPSQEVEQLADKSSEENATTFVAPYYTVSLPKDYADTVSVKTSYQEYSLGAENDTWGSNGPWFGFQTNFMSNNYCDFFVYASKELADGTVVGPQGTFLTQDIGAVGDWHILVCRGFQPWEKDLDKEAEEAKLAEFATYVSIQFQPYELSDSNFIQFLLTNSGRDWLANEIESNRNAVTEKMQHVLCSKRWDCLIGDVGKGAVREQSSEKNVDFARITFSDSAIRFESPFSAHTLASYNIAFSTENEYGIRDIETPPRSDEVNLTIAFSVDGGNTWTKKIWGIKLADSQAKADGVLESSNFDYDSRLSLSIHSDHEYSASLTFLDDEPFMDEASDSQQNLRESARSLIDAAITSNQIMGSLECEASSGTLQPLTADSEIVWVAPGQFEDYAFNIVNGYYVKVKTSWKSGAYGNGGSLRSLQIDEPFVVYEVYDYGNGQTFIRSVTD